MLRRYFLLFTVLFLLTASCILAETSLLVDDSSLVSSELLLHSGLKTDWLLELPVRTGEKIDKLYLAGEYLYVLTDMNYLTCIDTEKGTTRFQTPLALPGLPVLSPNYYDKKLWVMVGNRLLVIDPEARKIVESVDLKLVGSSTVFGPVRNARQIFIAGADRKLHVLYADDYVYDFHVTARNDSLINSLVVDDRDVVFTTDAGNVVSISAREAERSWQRDLPGPIIANIVRDRGWVYIGSVDTKLYKMNIFSGVDGWQKPFHTGVELRLPVQLGKTVVYQRAGEKGLYAIDKKTGQMIWHLENGTSLLAESGAKAYVYAEPGYMIVMDNVSGKKIRTLNFSGVNRWVANTDSSTIFIGDERGRIMSISGVE